MGDEKQEGLQGQEDLGDQDGPGEQQPVIFVEGDPKEEERLPEMMVRELDIKNKQWEEYV